MVGVNRAGRRPSVGSGHGGSPWHAPAPSLTVGGAVATPGTYSLTQLQALETTFTVSHSSWWWESRTETDQGVLLETLVNTAGP
ncbi:MAG TPA: hypothetical protein VIH85_13530, partial [Solirubrobacteraceae bacterium]